MKKTVCTIAIVAAALAGAASAQTVQPYQSTPDGQNPNNAAYIRRLLSDAEIVGTKGAFLGAVVKGAPYSGEEVTETTQTLADGTRIHNETRTSVYRDSEGRVRRETPDAVTVWDPVANASFFLNPKDQTYRQLPLAVQFFAVSDVKDGGNVTLRVGGGANGGLTTGMVPYAPAAPGPPGTAQMVLRSGRPNGPEHVESLGRQSVEGLPADGTRQTATIDTGAIGNDRPIQIASERWYSPDLQIAVMTKHSDPRTGEEVFRLINVTRGDPPASLFILPAGYQKLENK